MQNLSNHNHSQQTIEQNVVFLQNSRISPSVSSPSKSPRHAMDQARTFCFDVIISTTIFARRKSAGGNMIGLNLRRKSHASQPRPQGLLAFQYGGGRTLAHKTRQDKTLAHSELKRSLIGAFHCAFIRALSLVYSFQNKDGYPLRAS